MKGSWRWTASHKMVFTAILFAFLCVSCSDDDDNPAGPNNSKTTGTVKDVDGNVYKTVKIGNQWWMAENLEVTHYRNGDAIPKVIQNNEWIALSTGAYSSCQNNKANDTTYGLLYNWYAVTDSRNIAPKGWHVPTDGEWQVLADSLGGPSVAGGKMKATGTVEASDGVWYSPNIGATNESGFAALPGGWRYWSNGDFFLFQRKAIFYSATEYVDDKTQAWNRVLSYEDSEFMRDRERKKNGCSVRCAKD
jgi:uncharacterized protein (TIGR02145 family)